jgi:hypothetical protein
MTVQNSDKPSLSALLEAALAASEPEKVESATYDISRTSCRIPRTILQEVGALAHANHMSVSLIINLLLDSYLTSQGRPGYSELAPWYPDYAMRKKP